MRSASRNRSLSGVKRSGITRLTTPHLGKADSPSGEGRPPASTVPQASSASAPAATVAPPLSSPAALREVQPSTGNHRNGVAATTEHKRDLTAVPWRQGVAAVCQRLETLLQETERTLTPSVSLESQMHALERVAAADPLFDANRPTAAQAMEAVQRYRGGCMAAVLELTAIVTQRPRSPNTTSSRLAVVSPSSPPTLQDSRDDATTRSKGGGVSEGPVTSTLVTADTMELETLRDSYHHLESRLADALAAQAAYLAHVAEQQRQRERDGVAGEYLWTTRLLVEQEAAERVHLATMHHHMLSTLLLPHPQPPSPTRASASPDASKQPPKDADELAHLRAEKEALLAELALQQKRTAELLKAQTRDLRAVQERALAQLLHRQEAERSEWTRQLDAARQEGQSWQQRCAAAEAELQHTREQQQEAAAYTAAAQGGLEEQLRDTTRKMWHLQLANDHLDAKVRVLQREVAEGRVRRSPLRATPPLVTVLDSSDNNTLGDAHNNVSQPLIGVPAAARIAAKRSHSSHANSPRSSQLGGIPRLPDPPLQHRTRDDVRYGDPLDLRPRRAADEKGENDNDKEGEEAERASRPSPATRASDGVAVSPAVWLAYDERSSHLHTTPVKNERRSIVGSANASASSVSVSCSWVADRRSSGLPVFPTANAPPTASVAARGRGTGGGGAVPYTPLCSSTPFHHSSATPLGKPSRMSTVERRAPDGNSSEHAVHAPSPTRRQLSLERTPLQLSPQPAAAPTPEDSLVMPSDVSRAMAEEEEEAQSPSEPPLPPSPSREPQPPLTAPHDATRLSRGSSATKASDYTCDSREPPTPHEPAVEEAAVEEEEEGDGEEEGDSAATLPPSARQRLEKVRADILRHAEMLERDVQAVTARHDAAQRQRRRERDTIRVNAAAAAAAAAATAVSPTFATAHTHSGDGGNEACEAQDYDRALEQLHVAQQVDDDELAHYYADVNRKRSELERCLRVVEERLVERSVEGKEDNKNSCNTR